MDASPKKLYSLVSMRGIAAWLVVFFHSKELFQPGLPSLLDKVVRHGYLAVDLFFVLSGFIIYLNYHSKFNEIKLQEILHFYWNRLTRIYPAHFFVLFAYCTFILLFPYFSSSGKIPSNFTFRSLIESLFLVQAWIGDIDAWNIPSWSISAEWFVYLIFPFALTMLLRRFKTPRAHLIALVVLFCGIFAIYDRLGLASIGGNIASLALVRAMLEFCCGTLIGSLYVWHQVFIRQLRLVLIFLLILLSGAAAILALQDYAWAPAIFTLLIAFLSIDQSVVSRILGNRLLVYLGEISYSTYIVHYMIYEIFKAVFVRDLENVNQIYLYGSFLVVLLTSTLMHRFVEVPAQNFFRKKFAPTNS